MEDIGVNIVVWQNVVKALAVILMAAWALLVAYSRHHLGAVLVSICCNFSCYQDPFDFAAPQTMCVSTTPRESRKPCAGVHSAVQIIAGLVLGCSGGCVGGPAWPAPVLLITGPKILHIRSSLEATKEVFITLQISAVIVSRGIPYRVATS